MKRLLFFLPLSFIAIFYLHNLSSDVFGVDVGDLVTSAYVFGVAHPPGYPLFIFLGFILTHLPLPLSPVARMGLISVFSSLGALIIFYKFSLKISKSFLIAIISMLSLAFSFLFWFYAEIPEVFALNNFFAILLLFLAIFIYWKKSKTYIYLLAFFSTLSFTHQQTIVLIFPSIILLTYKKIIITLKNKKEIFKLSTLLLFGFLPYIYIPIAAFKHPVINWDNVINLKNFIHLLLRQDYGTFDANNSAFVPSSLFVRYLLVKFYFFRLFSALLFPTIIICVLGILKLFKSDRKLGYSLLLGFFVSGPLFIFYSAFPITNYFVFGTVERFYILSAIVLLFFFPYGLLFIRETLLKINLLSKDTYINLFMLLFLLIPFVLFRLNFTLTDLSKSHLGNNLGFDLLSSLPKNSAILLTGDNQLFNGLYVHYVLGFRKDVVVSGNPSEILRYVDLSRKNKIISLKRPIFTTDPALSPLDINFIWLPHILTYQLIPKNKIPHRKEYYGQLLSEFKQKHFIQFKNLATDSLSPSLRPMSDYYINSLIAIGDFIYRQYQDSALASSFYTQALAIDPNRALAYRELAVVNFKFPNNCLTSSNYLVKALSLDQSDRLAYALDYKIIAKCFNSQNRLYNLKEDYYLRFKEKLENEFVILKNDAFYAAFDK